MKRSYLLKILLLSVAAGIATHAASAQDVKPDNAARPEIQSQSVRTLRDRRGDLLHRLELTDDQIQQVRRIHAEQRVQMAEAQKRLREAGRALNDAIYSNEINERLFEERLKERQVAQAEVDRLRFLTEFSVRRILTQEQLMRFREMRQRFERVRESFDQHRKLRKDKMFRRQPPAASKEPTRSDL